MKLLTEAALLVVACASFAAAIPSGKFVADIDACPALSPRSPPTSIHDLRPDDIKVIGALGDSITAGYSVRDSNISLPFVQTFANVKEYRGLSYTGGGEKGAPTLPNFIKHYQSNLTGYSDGIHPPEMCVLEYCTAPYYPEIDNLNAAKSGAIAYRIDGELTYLINRMHAMKNIDFENDWKMISLQIGGNDQCQSCLDPDFYSADNFERYVDAALQRIQATIPKVIVNIIDQYHVYDLYHATKDSSHCVGPGAEPKFLQCPCPRGHLNLDQIKVLGNEFNRRLEKLYKKYQAKQSDTFAVVYQKLSLNFPSLPPDYFSNFDCFHASTVGQNFIARVLWNQLFVPQSEKPTNSIFSYDKPVYCPTDDDRIITY